MEVFEMKPYKRFRRMTPPLAVFLSLVFATSTPLAVASEVFASGQAQMSVADVSVKRTPPEVTLKETYRGANGKELLLFEDAHTNFSGQKSLAAAVRYFQTEEAVSTVFVEGSSADVSLGSARGALPDREWKTVAERFLRDGVISGEEYVNLTTDAPLRLLGIENRSLYDESLRSYALLRQMRQRALTYLGQAQSSVDRLKNKLYPKVLLNYESGLRVEADSAGSFFKLFDLAQGQNMDLSGFHGLSAIQNVRTEEKMINFELVNIELYALAEKTGVPLAVDSKKIKTSYALIEKTLNSARQKNISPAVYSNLARYAEYLRSLSDEEVRSAVSELPALEDKVYGALLQRSDAKLLRVVDRYLGLLDKAYHFQLSSEELSILRDAKQDLDTVSWGAFVNGKLAELGLSEAMIPFNPILDEANKPLFKFYDLVQERDLAFIDNIKRAMNGSGVEKAMLIAGGYHTAHLTELLRREGFSYTVYMPNVEHETNSTRYEKLLLAPFGQHLVVRSHADIEARMIRAYGAREPMPDGSFAFLSRFQIIYGSQAPESLGRALATIVRANTEGARLARSAGSVTWDDLEVIAQKTHVLNIERLEETSPYTKVVVQPHDSDFFWNLDVRTASDATPEDVLKALIQQGGYLSKDVLTQAEHLARKKAPYLLSKIIFVETRWTWKGPVHSLLLDGKAILPEELTAEKLNTWLDHRLSGSKYEMERFKFADDGSKSIRLVGHDESLLQTISGRIVTHRYEITKDQFDLTKSKDLKRLALYLNRVANVYDSAGARLAGIYRKYLANNELSENFRASLKWLVDDLLASSYRPTIAEQASAIRDFNEKAMALVGQEIAAQFNGIEIDEVEEVIDSPEGKFNVSFKFSPQGTYDRFNASVHKVATWGPQENLEAWYLLEAALLRIPKAGKQLAAERNRLAGLDSSGARLAAPGSFPVFAEDASKLSGLFVNTAIVGEISFNPALRGHRTFAVPVPDGSSAVLIASNHEGAWIQGRNGIRVPLPMLTRRDQQSSTASARVDDDEFRMLSHAIGSDLNNNSRLGNIVWMLDGLTGRSGTATPEFEEVLQAIHGFQKFVQNHGGYFSVGIMDSKNVALLRVAEARGFSSSDHKEGLNTTYVLPSSIQAGYTLPENSSGALYPVMTTQGDGVSIVEIGKQGLLAVSINLFASALAKDPKASAPAQTATNLAAMTRQTRVDVERYLHKAATLKEVTPTFLEESKPFLFAVKVLWQKLADWTRVMQATLESA